MAAEVKLLDINERLGSGGVAYAPFVQALKQEVSEVKAKYKIEVHLGKRRGRETLTPGVLMLWESGKRFHGGGDDKTYWCGYADCDKPIDTNYFGHVHVVCPSCNRELFLDHDLKRKHIEHAMTEGLDTKGLRRMAVVVGEKYFNLPTQRIAQLIDKAFNATGRNADIYLKFSPKDIRYDALHEKTLDIDKVEVARTRRDPVIYPLNRIIQDLTSGGDFVSRVRSFLEA
jgi:hypothetical protein